MGGGEQGGRNETVNFPFCAHNKRESILDVGWNRFPQWRRFAQQAPGNVLSGTEFLFLSEHHELLHTHASQSQAESEKYTKDTKGISN